MSSPAERGLCVLVVAPDEAFATACERSLSSVAGISVTVVDAAGEAIDTLASEDVDCVVSEHDLPEMDGVVFLEAVRLHRPTLPFLLFDGERSETTAGRAVAANVTEYLSRDRHGDQWDRIAALVEDAVRSARRRRALVDANARSRSHLDAASDVIAVVREGRFEYLNETGVDLLHADADTAILGADVDDVVAADGDFAARLDAVETGETAADSTDAHLIRGNGTIVPVRVTAVRIEWDGEPAVGLIARDVRGEGDWRRDNRLKNRAMDEAPVGITLADAREEDNPVIYANREFERITGYRRDEVVGRNCRFLQGEATRAEPVAAMRRAIDAEEPVTVELRNYREDGTEFWNRVTIAPIESGDGTVTHYVGFQEDVTDRKEDEEKLRRFRRAVEAAGHAVYITDPDGTITYVNPAFERITGYDSEEAIGRTPRILNSDEMSAEYYDRLWETISSGDVWAEEIRDRRKSGELYHAHQTIAPLTDDEGEIDAYVAIQTDITERKERETRLRQYERAVEEASELIAAVDRECRYLFANEAYRAFYGLSDDVSQYTIAETIGEEAFETIEPYLDRAFDGETIQYRMTRTAEGGSGDRTFQIRYYPLDRDTEAVRGVVATMRDITEQVTREQQLASLDRLLRHNIRNRLNVIQGHARMIRDGDADDVRDRAASIESVADEVLTTADKEREIVELLSEHVDPKPIDLAATVDHVVARLAESHPDAEIATDVPSDLRVTTIPKVERAVYELVENAIVHSDAEPPRVQITARATDGAVEVDIADDGPGIPDDERVVITGESDVEPLLHSSGMGLWLTKRIVDRAGGTIRFSDADLGGSAVTVVLPRGGPSG
ncbi:MAG: PAS domain S-box protein [Haloquadratum sp.]